MSSAANEELVSAARRLRDATGKLKFGMPVTHVYHPLEYAWDCHEEYLRSFGKGPKKIIFVGMNPGPFGMVQTGIPFGEIAAVRDWMKISARVAKPKKEHPDRPIEGFDCPRSEVSGQRLWGLFAKRFPKASDFFIDHFVVNYCPLAFLEEGGRNRTPDKLPAGETAAMYQACDEHLHETVRILQPAWVIGVGGFAQKRAELIFKGQALNIGTILHPSPASPAANRDWAGKVSLQLNKLGVWK
jgi:single-strand selective monofunctional uracil DNA glycosylase